MSILQVHFSTFSILPLGLKDAQVEVSLHTRGLSHQSYSLQPPSSPPMLLLRVWRDLDGMGCDKKETRINGNKDGPHV